MDPAPAPGRRQRRQDATRQSLLRAALWHFSERGISATRIEDITKRADVAKGAFYNYFASKGHLIASLLSEGVRKLQATYAEALEREPDERTRLETLIRAHADFFARERAQALLFHQARGLLLLREGRDPIVTEIFTNYLHELGASALPPGRQSGWSRDQITRLGAMVAGGVVGFQSYEFSAGLGVSGNGVFSAIAGAIATVIEEGP